MKRNVTIALGVLALGALTGCMPQEAQTPPDALEPKKMVRPEGMGAPPAGGARPPGGGQIRSMSPQDREKMRAQMGR